MPSATTARSLPLVAIALAVFVLVIQVRVVAGGKTWDDARYHTEVAPPRFAAAEQIRSGHVPAWWDGTGLGVPLLAEPSHAALSPMTWLASSPRGLDWIQLVHLVWCALGVAVWARRRGAAQTVGDPSALVAGLLVATTGVLASSIVRGALPGLAHLPWIGACAAQLAVAETRRERARMAVALGGLLGAIALAGVLAAFIDGALLALVLAARRRTAGWLAGALGAGLAIGAALWLPALVHLPHAAGATVHGLPLARLVELIVPGSFGSTDPARSVHALAGDHAWAPSLFVGAPLLALAAVRTPSRRALAIIAALVALALVVGRGGWPAVLGAPELHLAALVILLGAHAGAGIDALLDGNTRAIRALAVAIGCTIAVLVALAVLRARHPESASAIDRALLDGGLGVAFSAGALLLAWRLPGKLVPLVLAMLVLPSAGASGSIAPVTDRALVTEEPAFAAALASAPRPARFFRPAFMHDGPADLDDEIATLAGTSAARWSLVGARSSSPARPTLHDRTWLAAAQEGGVLLDRFGIGIAMLPITMVDSPRSQFHELARRGGWALVTLPVAPLASVMRSWMWQRDPAEALGLMFTRGGGTSLHRGTVILGGAGEPGASPLDPSPCALRAWEPGEIELGCTAAGYAVVSSSPSRGWEASVNGADTPWVTADLLRRAVKVPANASIVWTFHAPGFTPGLLLAALGIAALATMLAVGRRRELADDEN